MQNEKGGSVKYIWLMVMAVSAFIYLFIIKDGSSPVINGAEGYKVNDTGVGVKYDYDSSPSFYSYKSKNYFFCTKDGLKYVQGSGDIKWNKSFTMSSPKMIGNCSIVAIAEQNGRTAYVFNENGMLYEKHFDYPILSFSINSSGYLSVILQDNDDYLLYVYDGKGESPAGISGWALQDYNSIPVTSAVSNDGGMLAVGFWDINSTSAGSRIVFYTLKKDESYNLEDSMFASREKNGELLAIIRFMENNNLLAISDKTVTCYNPGDSRQLSEKWTIVLNNIIDQVSFSGDKSFAIAFGDVFLNKQGEKPGHVGIYNINGVKTGGYDFNGNVTYLYAGTNGVVAGVNRNYYVLGNKGELLWNYPAIQDIKQFIFLENTNTVLYAGNGGANVMRRAKSTPKEKQSQPEETVTVYEEPEGL